MDISDALNSLGITSYVIYGNPTNETEFNSMFRKVTGKDGDDRAILSSDPNDFGVSWAQASAKLSQLISDENNPLIQLKKERNRLLRNSDWLAVSDRTMTQEETDYRQALRDITNTYNSVATASWPTPPASITEQY